MKIKPEQMAKTLIRFVMVLVIGHSFEWRASAADRLPRSAPEAQGVSSEAITQLISAFTEQVDSMHGFMLVRHGQVVAEASWKPFDKDSRHTLYSLSKSFTSTAMGMAIDEGRLSLDDQVLSFFPGQTPANPSRNLESMRIRDLLSMSTGHTSGDLQAIDWDSEKSIVSQFLELEVDHKPGTHFLYNTPATYMCSAILQKVTGQRLTDYLEPRLFQPLGIEDPVWDACHDGIDYGGFGLNVRLEDIACFGQMLLQGGVWNNRQLVSQEWIDQAGSRQTSNGSNPDSDWEQGYGFQFWRCRHNAWRGDGAFGQFCIMIPDHDAVVAITSGTGNMGLIMHLIWEILLPDFRSRPLPENSKGHSDMVSMIRRLELPAVESVHPAAVIGELGSKRFVAVDAGSQIKSFSLSVEKDSYVWVAQTGLGEIRAEARPGTWTQADYRPLYMDGQKAGLGQRVPAAVSMGWVRESAFRLKFWLTETPFAHVIDLLVDKDDGTDKSVTMEYSLNVSLGGPRKRAEEKFLAK